MIGFIGALIISLSIGIPVYLHQMKKISEKEDEVINVIPSAPPELFQWQNLTISWQIGNFSDFYNYTFSINQNSYQNANNQTNQTLMFRFSPLEVGNYNFSLFVIDNSTTSGYNSTLVSIVPDQDQDMDGLFDHEEEWIFKSDPNNNDTDSDGLVDGEEITIYNTDLLCNDTDHDNLTDGKEVLIWQTDPILIDTDADGFSDWHELTILFTSPLTNDTDGDGIDEFSEVKFYGSNPLVINSPKVSWTGGSITLEFKFHPNEPHFVPYGNVDEKDHGAIPRTLYLYLINRVRDPSYFYIQSFTRISPVKILVIDNFNSNILEERIHGTTCVDILEDTINTNILPNQTTNDFKILTYSVAEATRTWETALNYGINHGIDIISLSQVAAWSTTPYFEAIHNAVNQYGILFCAGTGNDNNGDTNDTSPYHIRYPASHPDTLVIGGIEYMENQWVRWNDGSEGSNYGRGVIDFNQTTYYSAVEVVDNAYRRIFFNDYYGVSWAIPRIAAKCAILLQLNALLSPPKLKPFLMFNATQFTTSLYNYSAAPFPEYNIGWNSEVGYGKISVQTILPSILNDYQKASI